MPPLQQGKRRPGEAPTLPSGAAAAAKLLQSCLTLCDPTDGSPPGSPVPGILQARTLEWVEQHLIRASDAVAVPRASGLAWLLAGPP